MDWMKQNNIVTLCKDIIKSDAEGISIEPILETLLKIAPTPPPSGTGDICDVCAGTGKVFGDVKCACGGSGRMSDAVQYMRLQLMHTQAELARLKAVGEAVEKLKLIFEILRMEDDGKVEDEDGGSFCRYCDVVKDIDDETIDHNEDCIIYKLKQALQQAKGEGGK